MSSDGGVIVVVFVEEDTLEKRWRESKEGRLGRKDEKRASNTRQRWDCSQFACRASSSCPL